MLEESLKFIDYIYFCVTDCYLLNIFFFFEDRKKKSCKYLCLDRDAIFMFDLSLFTYDIFT